MVVGKFRVLLSILFLIITLVTFSQEEKIHYSLDAEFVYGKVELVSFIRDNFVRPMLLTR